jgi:hypothetical protein
MAKYTKQDLLASNKYKDKIDLLNALLLDNKEYSLKEVDKIINNFLKKGV